MNGFEAAWTLKKVVPDIPLMIFTESEMAIGDAASRRASSTS
jgi:hypothetical protein